MPFDGFAMPEKKDGVFAHTVFLKFFVIFFILFFIAQVPDCDEGINISVMLPQQAVELFQRFRRLTLPFTVTYLP